MLSYNTNRYGFDFTNLCNVPSDEKCTPIGHPQNEKWNKVECKVYQNQIRRMFPIEASLVKLDLIRNIHDFGIYYEVGAGYYESDEEQENAAFELENNIPEKWDLKALLEFKAAEHPLHFVKIISITG